MLQNTLTLGVVTTRPQCGCGYLEAEDDGPDESQRQSVVSVHNVVGAHVLQVNPLLLQELQSLVHVLQTVNTHPAFGRLRLPHRNTEEETPESHGRDELQLL